MRTYERTHPWITFSADLRSAPPSLWMVLGECQSKCEHIAGVPLQPGTAGKLYQIYLAKGVLATTAIEGNTLTEKEVQDHLAGKLELPKSRAYLTREIDNVVEACNLILARIEAGEKPHLTTQVIEELNGKVLAGLEVEEGVKPGRFRSHEVGVAKYKGAPAEDCKYLVDKLTAWLSSSEFAATKETGIATAIIKAVLAHLYLAWIHPFGDGNGRTARLVEFQILIASGVPAPAAHLLSNHYNQTRSEYYRQLQLASSSGGNVLPFLQYAAQGFCEGLRSQLQMIRNQQWEIAWRDYVHDLFRDRTSRAQIRQRHLILDLSDVPEPVSLDDLRALTPRVAAAYSTKTKKTLARDVNALVKARLIAKTAEGKLYADKNRILAFLPPKADE